MSELSQIIDYPADTRALFGGMGESPKHVLIGG